MKARNKFYLMSLGSIVGILTVFGASALGATFLYVQVMIGFLSFGVTGILFGA